PSGATIHTSSESARAMPARMARPGASTPSSLVSRMRGAMSAPADRGEAAHIGAQRLGDQHRAVLLLVVLEDGDEAAAHRHARAVERVHIAGGLPLARRTIARLHAAG